MARKSTVDKLNKPATVIVKFGGYKVKHKFDRLSEVFAQLRKESPVSKKMIVMARRQLGRA